jgi:hypothetical protein
MKKDYKKELGELSEIKKSFEDKTLKSSDNLEQNFNHLFSKNISDASDIIKALRPIINDPDKRRDMINDLLNNSIFMRDLRNDYSNINSHSKLKIHTKKKGYFLKSNDGDLITNDVEDSIFFFLSILWDTLKAHYKDKAPDEFFLDLINLTEAGMDLYNNLAPSQLNYYKRELESTQAKIIELELELSNLRLTESKILEKIKEYED